MWHRSFKKYIFFFLHQHRLKERRRETERSLRGCGDETINWPRQRELPLTTSDLLLSFHGVHASTAWPESAVRFCAELENRKELENVRIPFIPLSCQNIKACCANQPFSVFGSCDVSSLYFLSDLA